MPNMVVCGGVGAKKCLEDRMGSAYGSQSVLVGIVFPASSHTRSVMVPG